MTLVAVRGAVVVMGFGLWFWKISCCQYFSCTFCSQAARAKTTEQAPEQNSQLGKQLACPFELVRGALLPLGMSLSARTPQTGLRPKTSLFFGFFVCFESIQSLRNLWFWLEMEKQNKTKKPPSPGL